jgi:uncharacterized membrane protein YebE (DUF533 family)
MAGESDRPLDMLSTMAGGGMGEGRGVHGGLGRSGAMMTLAGVAAKAVQGRDHPPEEDDVPGAYDPYQAERLDSRHAETAIRAMFAAVNAEAGGDSAERARLLRDLEQAGATEEERRHVERELAANASLETVVGEVDNAETAEQVYAASIAALSPDSEASRRYLRELRACLTMKYYGRLWHRHAGSGGNERVRRHLQHFSRAVRGCGSGGGSGWWRCQKWLRCANVAVAGRSL